MKKTICPARDRPRGRARRRYGDGADVAANQWRKPADKASQKFIKAAIEGDIAEIDVGKLAQEKGQSEAVKEYGAMLVKDHGGQGEGEEVANQLGVTPPTGSSFGEKATYAKLKLLSGATFDRVLRQGHGQGPPGRHQGIPEGSEQERPRRPVRQGNFADVAQASSGRAAADGGAAVVPLAALIRSGLNAPVR